MTRGEVQGFNPDKLREHRQAHGYSIEILAALAEISTPTLTSWEIGRRTPTPSLLANVAATLDIPVRELMDRDSTDLRDLREDAGLNRRQVAAAINRSPVTLSDFENGRKPPHDDDVEYLAALYKVEPAQVRAAAEASAANWRQVLDTAREQRNTPGPKPGGAS